MTMVYNIIKEKRILKIYFLFSFQKQLSRQSQWATSVRKGRYLEGETLYLEWNSVSKHWLGTYYVPGAGQTPVTHDRSLPSRNASSGVRGRHIIKRLLVNGTKTEMYAGGIKGMARVNKMPWRSDRKTCVGQTGLGTWGLVSLAGIGSRMSSDTRSMILDLETFLTAFFRTPGPHDLKMVLLWS